MMTTNRSFANTFFGKPHPQLRAADLRRVIGQRGGLTPMLQKPRGRQILLYAFKIPIIWDALELPDFLTLVPALESIPLGRLESAYELYRLAALANTTAHAITDLAGLPIDEGCRALQVKNRALARLIERFGQDIILTEEHDVFGPFLSVRLRQPFTKGLHIRRAALDRLIQQETT